MIPTDPGSAPPRTDLPFLRHRSSRRPASNSVPAIGDFLSGRTSHHHPRADAVPPARAPSVPSPSLDLDTPTPPEAPAAPPSLDLDAPDPIAVRGSTPATRSRPAAPAMPRHPVRRIAAGRPTVLSPTAPTVTLDRLQTGIGTLTITAACSADVGDLRLGAVYQLDSGLASVVVSSDGNRFAPPDSRRYLIVGGRDRFEHLALDLRQCRALRRLAILGYSASRQPLQWGGTIVITTYGGGEIEIPLEAARSELLVLATIYNVDGEFVLRAERQPILGDVREAARAYGYDTISWLDGRTPLD